VFRDTRTARRYERVTDPHPALAVEAVGFRSWQGHWLGVLITPLGSFECLCSLPGTQADWKSVAEGKWDSVATTAGERRFYSIVDLRLARCMPIPCIRRYPVSSDHGTRRRAPEAQRCLSQLLEAPPDENTQVCDGRRAARISLSGVPGVRAGSS